MLKIECVFFCMYLCVRVKKVYIIPGVACHLVLSIDNVINKRSMVVKMHIPDAFWSSMMHGQ